LNRFLSARRRYALAQIQEQIVKKNYAGAMPTRTAGAGSARAPIFCESIPSHRKKARKKAHKRECVNFHNIASHPVAEIEAIWYVNGCSEIKTARAW
jgi:hypothetical protein